MLIKHILSSLGVGWSVTPVEAYFRMSCPGRLARERLDPIVNSGKVSGHVHFISGGSAFSASMTYEDARKAKCSSCTIKQDLSNYWTPQLYAKFKNGTFAPVPIRSDGDDHGLGMTVYYFQRYGDGEHVKAFPPGFRMFAGDPLARNFTDTISARALKYYCDGGGLANDTWGLPDVNCPGYLKVMFFMPSCWNGKEVAPAGGRSHMSYPIDDPGNGKCPPNFPIHLPTLFYELEYDTGRLKDEWVDGKHPFAFANGDTTGYGFHGDFLNGWDVDVLQEALDTCTTDPGGAVSACHVLDRFTVEECNACKLPSIVQEDVTGPLKALPGCNPLTHGPQPASPVQNCDDTALLGDFAPNYVDLTETKQWSYIGCGTDDYFTRALHDNHTASDAMTVETCVNFCAASGSLYAGLEFGRECWCGSTLAAANAPREGFLGACSMKCAGDATQLCGAGSALSLYRKCADAGECRNYQFGGAPELPSASSSSSSSLLPPLRTSTGYPASTTTLQTITSSSVATPTPTTKAPKTSFVCPHNNCNNAVFGLPASPSASVVAFCKTYTLSMNTDTSAIPPFLENCEQSPERMSSACTCLAHATAYWGH